MLQGYIKLHRKIQDNELWLKEKFTKAQAWVDLIMLANHKDAAMDIRGNLIKVKRGQVGWGERALARRWQWSQKKVQTFLKYLKNESQLELQKSSAITLKTIINYDMYQSKESVKESQKNHRRITEESQKNQNNNVKNNKNVKNDKELSVQSLQLSALLAEKIFENNSGNKHLQPSMRDQTISRWAKDIDKMLRIDNRNAADIENVITWCQSDSFWSSNILSGEKLRKQYDQLSVKINQSKKDEPYYFDES